jgi:hypothetical protein
MLLRENLASTQLTAVIFVRRKYVHVKVLGFAINQTKHSYESVVLSKCNRKGVRSSATYEGIKPRIKFH